MNARAQFHAVPRLDLYTAIHKALRAQLCDALVAAGRLDPNDEAEVADVLARVRKVIDLTRYHLHHEDFHVHPLLEACEPGAAGAAVREHDEHQGAFERLEALARSVERAQGPAREAAALDLYRELALFAAADFRHLHGEETANNAVLWRRYSDQELRRAQDAIVASVDPARMQEYMRWLLAALAPHERAALLAAMPAGG